MKEEEYEEEKSVTASARSSDKDSGEEIPQGGPIVTDTINSDTLTTHPSALSTLNTSATPPQVSTTVPLPFLLFLISLENQTKGSEGFVMILDVVCSTIRNVKTVLSKLTALDIFQKMIPYLGMFPHILRQIMNNPSIRR